MTELLNLVLGELLDADESIVESGPKPGQPNVFRAKIRTPTGSFEFFTDLGPGPESPQKFVDIVRERLAVCRTQP